MWAEGKITPAHSLHLKENLKLNTEPEGAHRYDGLLLFTDVLTMEIIVIKFRLLVICAFLN